MTDIYLYFMFAHYGLYGNAPVSAARTISHSRKPTQRRTAGSRTALIIVAHTRASRVTEVIVLSSRDLI